MSTSIMGRAQDKGLVEVRVHQLRDHGLGRHRQVDDTPYGGGPGMVLRPEPLFELFEKYRPAGGAGQLPVARWTALQPSHGTASGAGVASHLSLRSL